MGGKGEVKKLGIPHPRSLEYIIKRFFFFFNNVFMYRISVLQNEAF